MLFEKVVNGGYASRVGVKQDFVAVNLRPLDQRFINREGVLRPVRVAPLMPVHTGEESAAVGDGLVIRAPAKPHLLVAEDADDERMFCPARQMGRREQITGQFFPSRVGDRGDSDVAVQGVAEHSGPRIP